MSSESTETQTVTVSLPPELDDWLETHAEAREVDRDTLLVQLLSAYRTTAEFDETGGEGEVTFQVVESGTIDENLEAQLEEAIVNHLDDALEDRIEATVSSLLADSLEDRISQEVEETLDEAVTAQISEATNAVQTQLGNRIDAVESEYKENLQDVRQRVIQVKKDTDKKAPADHTHEELREVAELGATVSDLEEDLATLRTEYDETVPDHEERLADIESRLEEVDQRLQTVAWVVSDLREAHESGGGLEAVDRIKRAAAKADIERANCENCGEGVQLSLLTEPECPHCSATVSNVEPSSGWFSKPKLLVASQLESGEN